MKSKIRFIVIWVFDICLEEEEEEERKGEQTQASSKEEMSLSLRTNFSYPKSNFKTFNDLTLINP